MPQKPQSSEGSYHIAGLALPVSDRHKAGTQAGNRIGTGNDYYTMQKIDPYRERALKLFPWICTRCAREFPASRLRELTVHHKDGNHDNNPSDGSNWELLCLYCHDAEHSRHLDEATRGGTPSGGEPIRGATHNPFAHLRDLLKRKE